MNSFFQMFNIQIVLLIYLLCGILCRKVNIITKTNQKQFVAFVLNILMPCMVFNSFKSITISMLFDALLVLILSLSVCLIALIVGRFAFKNFPDDKKNILRYATLVNNAGFAGLPLASAMYGDQGLIYASIFLIPIRIFMWSAGITMLSNNKVNHKKVFFQLMKNPNIIAVVLGMLRGLFQIPLPSFLDTGLANLSSCVSPMSMIIIGAIISDIKLNTLLEKGVISYTFIRLILMPILILEITSILGIDSTIVGVCSILTGMPAATSTALLASQYNCNVEFASKIVFTTTIGSLITAPTLMLFI